ncbi:hypothetical protein [Lichenicoccus sp.]|uniref:hypothetical protein n=1 Tax=Lichenicoccus sp. TaxID=2781899 RepID=UPI003D13A9B6
MNWEKPCGYDDAQKTLFHSTARTRLKRLAAELGLPAGSYDLRSNKAGVAVSGEVTLHHDQVYIQVGQSCMGAGMGVLIRTCRGRRDFTGGMNNFAPLALLDDLPALAERVRRIAPQLGRRAA